MLYQLNFEKILFLDIETVPMVENYDLLPEKFRMLWDKKSEYLKRNPEDTSATIFNRAGIYAEFGKIVCISVGYQYNQDFRMKSFYGEDEFILLQEFAELLNRHFNHRDHMLCAHNGKEFDYPYIARRMLINGIPLPQVINLAGVKHPKLDREATRLSGFLKFIKNSLNRRLLIISKSQIVLSNFCLSSICIQRQSVSHMHSINSWDKIVY